MGRLLVINGADFSANNIGQIEFGKLNIQVIAEPSNGGTISGGGIYKEGTQVILNASPSNNFAFTKWDDDVTENPRTIIVSDSKTTYKAFFEDLSTHALTESEANYMQKYAILSVSGTTSGATRNMRLISNNGRSVCMIDIERLRSLGYKTLYLKQNQVNSACCVTNNVLNDNPSGAMVYTIDAKTSEVGEGFGFYGSYNINLNGDIISSCKYLYIQSYQSTFVDYNADWTIIARK